MKIKKLFFALIFLLAFVLWTFFVINLDVKPIGPNNSCVGLSTLNGFIYKTFGVNFLLYNITDWLGLVPILFALGFAVLGFVQWIKRKNILKVDYDILILGVFYLITFALYILFEIYVINYRPVLINSYLEASYPSSTTILVLCIMPTAIIQFNHRIKNKIANKICVLSVVLFTAFMVIGRLLSGVHWFSDIIGGIFISSSLVFMYDFVFNAIKKPNPTKC